MVLAMVLMLWTIKFHTSGCAQMAVVPTCIVRVCTVSVVRVCIPPEVCMVIRFDPSLLLSAVISMLNNLPVFSMPASLSLARKWRVP